MADLNPYSPPAPDRGAMVPGYYVSNLRHLTLREIWRLAPRWSYPLMVLMIKCGMVKGGRDRFTYLPSTVLTERCAAEDVPENLREFLAPLIAQATQAGFHRQLWGMDRHSVQLKSTLVSAGVHLFDGRDTDCWLSTTQGVTSGKTINKVRVSFFSLTRDGLLLATRTEDKGFDHHPRSRVQVVRRADFATLLAAHRRRLAGGIFEGDAEVFFRYLATTSIESWEERIRRGLYRRVATTREELDALIGTQVNRRTAPTHA